jgi:hypothetical protein
MFLFGGHLGARMRACLLAGAGALTLAACDAATAPEAATAPPVGAVGQETGTAEAAGVAPEAAQTAGAAGAKTISFGDLAGSLPAKWEEQRAAGQFRLAQYLVPKAEGDPAQPQFIVFHFGRGCAGSVEDNVKRWMGMMRQPDGGDTAKVAKRSTSDRDGLKITSVDAPGTYLDRPFPMAQQFTERPNYRMLAAVVETTREGGDGPYYLRLVGPAKSVAAAKPGWDGLLASLKPRE